MGPLLNPNLLAALVLLTGPLALEKCLGPKKRVVWGIGFALLTLGLFISHSLAAYGTFLIQGVLAAGFLLVRKEFSRTKILLLLAGVVLLGGYGIYLARGEWPKLFNGDSDRWTWGLTALRTFAAHPFLGVGPGSFGEAYPIYRASPWGLNSLYAHNFFLEFLAERGLVGAGALFLLMGTLIHRAWKSVSQGPGLFLGLVGFCFYNLFHIGFSFPALFWLFFLIAGLAGEGKIPEGTSDLVFHKKPWIILMALLSFLVGLASFALFRSDQSLVRARLSIAAERWDRAAELVEKGLFWNRWNSGLYEVRAGVRLKSQDWVGAKADLDRAVALAPSSAGFRAESAELAVERGDVDQALKDYDTATRLLPLKAAFWERRGDLLSGMGRKEDAGQAYAGALRALSDARVLGGDADRRAEWTKRVEEKKQSLFHVPKN
ncbi:MAG: tetratricopeptide repeat protein [Elusimicrobia bacterium]|nr:tetratricopeptide repeat protein [Elusimicrobiota bacterium]